MVQNINSLIVQPPKCKGRSQEPPPSLIKLVTGEVLLKLPSVKFVVQKEGSKFVLGEVLLKLPTRWFELYNDLFYTCICCDLFTF